MGRTIDKLDHVRVGLFILIGLVFIQACQNRVGDSPEATKDSVEVKVKREFGIAVDSFYEVKDEIKSGQFLESILTPYGVSKAVIADIARKSKDIFDIRKLKAGRPYTVFSTKDSSHLAQYFIYQPDDIDYVVFDLRDSVRIYKDKFPIEVKEVTAAGIIEGSLYKALRDFPSGMNLTGELAKIYAWDIDFYRAQKGDWFKVIYDENYVKDKPISIRKIKAALFHHNRLGFYAFYYKNDSTDTEGYYDQNGKSLRKAFLKAPLKYFRITSHYTRHRFHPIQHRMKAHLGTDYAAPTGTPIMATATGTVIASRYTRFNGNYVKIKHNSVYTTQYLHMSKRAVRVGQHVVQGQTIGYVGSTGLATGPHVCYRFWKNGRQVNPLNEKFPSAEPLEEVDKGKFDKMIRKEMSKLTRMGADSIPDF